MDQSKMLVRVGFDGLSVNQAVVEWKRNTNDWKSWLPGSESSVTAIAKMDNDNSSELVVSIKKDETSPTIEIEDYFPDKALRMIINQPLEVSKKSDSKDVSMITTSGFHISRLIISKPNLCCLGADLFSNSSTNEK